jgi:hypothetical protein
LDSGHKLLLTHRNDAESIGSYRTEQDALKVSEIDFVGVTYHHFCLYLGDFELDSLRNAMIDFNAVKGMVLTSATAVVWTEH